MKATTTDPRICIIGAGMSGMLMAIKLLKAGYTNFKIYERASTVGGTWRENRYPGVACDVASFAYCYDFEPNPNWSHRFSPGAEILEYFKRTAKKYNLLPHISFNTEVTRAAFKDGQWHIDAIRNIIKGNFKNSLSRFKKQMKAMAQAIMVICGRKFSPKTCSQSLNKKDYSMPRLVRSIVSGF